MTTARANISLQRTRRRSRGELWRGKLSRPRLTTAEAGSLSGTSLHYDRIAQVQRNRPLPERRPINDFADAMKAALTVGVRGIITSRGTRASTPCGAHKERWAA
jgi:hypothetical protein